MTAESGAGPVDPSGDDRSPTVGLLYPGFSAQDDFASLERRLAGAIRLPLVHTSVGEDLHDVPALLDLGGVDRLAAGATELLAQQPDSILWACTSGSFVFGWDGARRQVDRLAEQTARPASSTSLAFVEAGRRLGLGRVAVLASYPAAVADLFVEFLGRGGIAVDRLDSRGILTAAEVGALPTERVVELVAGLDRSGVDAVLIPDTALHTLAVLPDLETAAGVPVLTANQVTVWQGLALLGEVRRLPGMGVLFR